MCRAVLEGDPHVVARALDLAERVAELLEEEAVGEASDETLAGSRER